LIYDFDQVQDRKGTNSIKWEAGALLKTFGITERFDEDTISLFVADMDFPCAEPIVRALRERVDRKISGYSTHLLDPEYFRAIQEWFGQRHGWDIDKESIVYCPGTVEAIHLAVHAFTQPGDGIIIQQPVYHPFISAVMHNGRKLRNNALINEDGYYRIDFQDLEEKASEPGTTMFILCSPHNPVGRVWTTEELERMAAICRQHGVVLIADEIHGDLLREGIIHHPILTLADDPNIISCTAINKTFNVAGLHCTNLVINDPERRKKLSKVMGMRMPSPFSIEAVKAAYFEGSDWLRQVNAYIDGNFRFLDEFLKDRMPGVRFKVPEGTYIGWMDFRDCGLEPKEVHRRIYMEANVVLEDGEMFGEEGTGFQRICVPSPRPLLREAMERIAAQFQDLN